MLALVLFSTLLLAGHGAPLTADLEERIDHFAQGVLTNTTTKYYSAAVLVGAVATTRDPYVVAAASIKRAMDGTVVFLTGGTDTDGLTHVVIVQPSATPPGNVSDVSDAMHAVARTTGMTIEHSMTGARSSTGARTVSGRCITLGRRCKCSNKCKCTGDSRTLTCSCTKFLWWTCDCPASNKCSCGSLWVNGNFCKKV